MPAVGPTRPIGLIRPTAPVLRSYSSAVSSEPERTADGRWIVVGGRRWRATDPSIPEPFRQELVDELMDARRAVGDARRRGDSDGEAAARTRVGRAKTALGERGEPWWEPPTDAGGRARLAATMLALAKHRGSKKTICPSDATRAIGGGSWRSLSTLAREVARDLASAGDVDILQRGEVLDPHAEWKGPIRIRMRST